MAVEFRFPDVGSGISEGDIVKVKCKVGDVVKEDQVLFDIETAKAVVEMPSPASGTILAINVKEGQTIKVGDVIAVIGEKGEKVESKAALPKPQPQTVQSQVSSQAKPAQAVSPALSISSGRIVATPHTRQLAKQLGVDINSISGTGVGGRITDEDIQNSAKGGSSAKGVKQSTPQIQESTQVSQSAQVSSEPKTPKVSFEKFGQILRVPIKGVRKAIVERMELAARVPMVTNFDEADITDISKVRDKEKKIADKKGYKLTYLPFITKACIVALKEYPYVNSSIDKESNEIILKKYYNIGIAVDTPEGLIVPVIKGANKKSIKELAMDMEKLSDKARDRSISLDEIEGGTFTITNLGTIGGSFFTPILNYPESAILGLGKIREEIIKKGKKKIVKKTLPLSLTYDHRIIDGALAAKFLNTIVKHLEDPDLLFVDE